MQRQEKEYSLTYALRQALRSDDATKLQKELSKKKYQKKPALLNLSLPFISESVRSPLIDCAYNRRKHCFRLLLERNDLNVNQSCHGWTVMHFLAYWLFSAPQEKAIVLEMLDLLLKDKRFEFKSEMSDTPVVTWAFKNLSEASRSRLLAVCFNSEITALYEEAKSAYLRFNVANAALLSTLASDPDFPIDTVLHTNETLLRQCILDNHTEAALLALQRPDININLTNANGDTALILAAKLGRSAIVAALLARNDVNLHQQNKSNHTPITSAFMSGYTDMGHTMLRHPYFDPTHLYNYKTNILMLAASCQAYSLLQYILNLNILDVNAQDANGNTALMHTVSLSDNAKVPNLLFKHGANPHIQNNEEYNPYMKARQNQREAIKYLLKKMMQDYPHKVVIPETSFTPAKQLHDLLDRIAPTPEM